MGRSDHLFFIASYPVVQLENFHAICFCHSCCQLYPVCVNEFLMAFEECCFRLAFDFCRLTRATICVDFTQEETNQKKNSHFGNLVLLDNLGKLDRKHSPTVPWSMFCS